MVLSFPNQLEEKIASLSPPFQKQDNFPTLLGLCWSSGYHLSRTAPYKQHICITEKLKHRKDQLILKDHFQEVDT